MKTENYKVTFLLDRENNWFEPYAHDLYKSLLNSKYSISIEHYHGAVLNQDIVFIIGFTKKLDDEFLMRNRLNLVIHESNLPNGRGFSPVQWQILECKNSIPITLFEANSKLDSGDIFLRSTIELNGLELYNEIRAKQAASTVHLINEFLNSYPNYSATPQLGIASSYPKRTAQDSALDINKSIAEQFNLLRIANNEEWPAFFYHEKKKYILKIYSTDDYCEEN